MRSGYLLALSLLVSCGYASTLDWNQADCKLCDATYMRCVSEDHQTTWADCHYFRQVCLSKCTINRPTVQALSDRQT